MYVLLSLQNGWTPLAIAAYNGHVDVSRALIAARVDVNATEMVWYTNESVYVHCFLFSLCRVDGQHFNWHHNKGTWMWFVYSLRLMLT